MQYYFTWSCYFVENENEKKITFNLIFFAKEVEHENKEMTPSLRNRICQKFFKRFQEEILFFNPGNNSRWKDRHLDNSSYRRHFSHTENNVTSVTTTSVTICHRRLDRWTIWDTDRNIGENKDTKNDSNINWQRNLSQSSKINWGQ